MKQACTKNTTIKWTQCMLLLHFVSKQLKMYCFSADDSHFIEVRPRYSNRTVTYSNTTVRIYRYTLIKQSVL